MRARSLSAKEELILGLLIANGAMYGLEMVKASKRKLKRGTVYVTLGRMEEKRYVLTAISAADGSPPRRLYAATERGRRVHKLTRELAEIHGRTS